MPDARTVSDIGRGDPLLASVGLVACDAELAAHADAVYRRFGRVALGVLDLPPLSGSSVVPAQVRLAGVLYWAGELDEALLVTVVEALASAAFLGTAPPAIAAISDRLAPIFRSRRTRLAAAERAALLARVHGGPDARRAEMLRAELARLAGALVAIGAEPTDRGIGALVARAEVLADDLAAKLSERAVGMSAFAAREILGQIREAIAILRTPAVASAYGGRGWTTAWRTAARALCAREVDPSAAIARAVHGQRLIAWLGARTPLDRNAAVVRDAAAYGAALGRGGAEPVSPGGGGPV